MRKKTRIFLAAAVLCISAAFVAYYYVMHGGARNISKEDTAFVVTSSHISSEFASDPEMANKKYLEKAIVVSGTVSAISGNDVTLDRTVICSFGKRTSLKIGSPATVKGRVVGFDDLMGEVRVDQCTEIKN